MPWGPRLKSWLTPPDAALPFDQVVAVRTLHLLLISILIFWFIPFYAVILPLFVIKKVGSGLASLYLLAGVLGSLVLLRRGHLRAAVWVFLANIWTISTAVVLLSGGVHSPAMSTQMVVIVSAAWLAGRRAALIAWGLFLLSTLAMAIAEVAGHPAWQYFPLPPIATWSGLALTTAVVALPLAEFLRQMQHSLSTTSQQLQELGATQRSLHESEARHRVIFESAQDAIFVADAATGIIEGANPAAARLLGQSREDLIGLHQRDLHPAGWRDEAERNFQHDVVQPGRTEGFLLHSSGQWVPVDVSASVIESGDGRKLVVGVFRDASARKQAEAERAALVEQLLQAQKLESVGRLAGGIAHDFNNLLTVINGYAEVLKVRLGPADRNFASLDAIHTAGERAAKLTQQLLAFSRKQMAHWLPLDLNAVVLEVEPMMQRLLREDIQLSTHLAPGLPRVMADSTQMHQVLLNLATNARDAMPHGGQLRITTRRHQLANGAALVVLEVADSGEGMSAAVRDKIFEPFFTTKPVGVGTGLGLSTVYGIIQQMQGEITVESEPGAGATFRMFLPATGAQPEPSEPGRSEPEEVRGHGVVLLVEDQEGVRLLTADVLRAGGYTVLEAPSGEEALELSRTFAGRIHLLLTDLIMPGISGTELARRLLLERPDLRILATSGYSSELPQQPGESRLDFDFLPKPFTPTRLLERVRQVLSA